MLHERRVPALRIVPPYYEHPAYVDALTVLISDELRKLAWKPDHCVLSFHGIPISYAQAGDPIIVADGKKVTKDFNQLRAAWTDYSGTFLRRPGQPNTERTGAAVFVDPHQPDFPPEWITRLYGVLNVSYPGLRMLDLPKGQPLRLHYRIWIHRGDAGAGQVDAAYKTFAADWHWSAAAATQSAPAH